MGAGGEREGKREKEKERDRQTRRQATKNTTHLHEDSSQTSLAGNPFSSLFHQSASDLLLSNTKIPWNLFFHPVTLQVVRNKGHTSCGGLLNRNDCRRLGMHMRTQGKGKAWRNEAFLDYQCSRRQTSSSRL